MRSYPPQLPDLSYSRSLLPYLFFFTPQAVDESSWSALVWNDTNFPSWSIRSNRLPCCCQSGRKKPECRADAMQVRIRMRDGNRTYVSIEMVRLGWERHTGAAYAPTETPFGSSLPTTSPRSRMPESRKAVAAAARSNRLHMCVMSYQCFRPEPLGISHISFYTS
jgi:hypothetical protein